MFMGLDSRVYSGMWLLLWTMGCSFLPPPAISTVKPDLSPWTASASSVVVTHWLPCSSVPFYALKPFSYRYPREWWLRLAQIQLILPCCFCLNGGILFPWFLGWGRYATGSPSSVRLSLPHPCHTREQHFCKITSYWLEFMHAGS